MLFVIRDHVKTNYQMTFINLQLSTELTQGIASFHYFIHQRMSVMQCPIINPVTCYQHYNVAIIDYICMHCM